MIYWAMHGGSLFIGMIPNPFIGSSHWFLMEHVGKYTSPHGSYGFVHGRFDLFRPTCGDLINTHEPHPSNELLATWSFQGSQCHCPSFWGGLHAIHIYIYIHPWFQMGPFFKIDGLFPPPGFCWWNLQWDMRRIPLDSPWSHQRISKMPFCFVVTKMSHQKNSRIFF